MNDGILRLAVLALGGIGCLCVLGMAAAACLGRPIPEALAVALGGAIGSLGTIVTPRLHQPAPAQGPGAAH